MTWFYNSVGPGIALQLQKFSSAKDTWDHLATVYWQDTMLEN